MSVISVMRMSVTGVSVIVNVRVLDVNECDGCVLSAMNCVYGYEEYEECGECDG